MNDTTQRISTKSVLDSLRNVNNRIAVLTLRRSNNGFLTSDENKELTDLHTKLDRLNREYDEARRLLDQNQRAAANNDPMLQRNRVNTIRR
jgi:hypothetical protein